ncbi:hypothetical protein DS909_22740 [Phaeobacter gallaeciensis]|uniref:Uncharacterized protein n=3 Tax=Rhodobacterales TaxID=204455 RepID=A0A366WHI2_9RHOB|nr:hypothetical protein [Falsiruegeria litorea]MBT3143735.1 hypothetical protein [Falsiruegeria litorea]MBT8168005.1 hypothetical protein [Falsiruegeria litorea]RBW49508.1 hypothetical protein DS909_22740 [Phaeobacter gallaeciensis]
MSAEDQIAQISTLLHRKLGVRGKTLSKTLRKAKHRLPRRIHKQAMSLAKVETLAHHPKLRLTLDLTGLGAATREVTAYLNEIDLADRRKGWWLSMLGGLAFNVLVAAALLILFLWWRNLI